MKHTLLWSLPLIAAVDSSSASNNDASGQPYSIPQVAAGQVLLDVPSIIQTDLARYGVSPAPRPVSNVANMGTSITATPNDVFDDLYLCSVNVGGKTMSLHFDTGSSDL